MPLGHIVEDPFTKDSADSLFLQMVDVAAYSAFQQYRPNAFVKKQGAKTCFQRLTPVLLTVASRSNPLGMLSGNGKKRGRSHVPGGILLAGRADVQIQVQVCTGDGVTSTSGSG